MSRLDLQTSDRYCVFQTGSSWFALPALSVREVSVRPKVDAVPRSDAVLAGICHIRNEFLPVVSLRALSGETDASATAEQQMLVIVGLDGPWGLLIDRAVALEPLETSFAADSELADGWPGALTGSASHGDEVVRVLDPDRLYRLVVNVLERSWNETEKLCRFASVPNRGPQLVANGELETSASTR